MRSPLPLLLTALALMPAELQLTEIYIVRNDGSGLKRVTKGGNFRGSPKQPCGEIFLMRKDGTGVEQLTDNQWEEGTPA